MKTKVKKNNQLLTLDLKNLEPDLYLRYHLVFEQIKKIQKDTPCQILEIGGKESILGKFIKTEKLPYQLTIIDLLPNDQINPTICDKYITSNIFSYNTTTTFDYILSIEVLEHISDKEKFLEKILPLGKHVIISAPFKSKIITYAEKTVNNFFKKYTGQDHPWLKEHFEANLPSEKWFKNYLNQKNLHYSVFKTNHITNWISFMLVNLLPAIIPISKQKINRINYFYNSNYKSLNDSYGITYRKIYFISPNNYSIKQLPTKINPIKLVRFHHQITDLLTNQVYQTYQITEKQKNLLIENKDILNKKITKLLKTIKHKDSLISQNKKDLNHKIFTLEKNIATKNKLILKKNKITKRFKLGNDRLKSTIQTTQKEIEKTNISLDKIKTSKFFKLWQIYNKFKKTIV